MLYDIRLRLSYDYDGPAANGRHVACLMPSDTPVQRVISGRIEVEPAPDERQDRLDFFDNRVTGFALNTPHRDLVVRLEARVKVLPRPAFPAQTPTLEGMAQQLTLCRDLGAYSPLHFRAPSARVPFDPAMSAFARANAAPGMGTLDAALALSRAIHRHMEFDPKATTVDTPAAEAFARRKGVCQDFSHVMIACLRGLGIPAVYVSGFLRTLPPPGKPRLEGADAMHAWVSVWCGDGIGWIELDPTNDMPAGTDHIRVARGRDYSDVSPLKGVLRVAGGQTIAQAVDVIAVG